MKKNKALIASANIFTAILMVLVFAGIGIAKPAKDHLIIGSRNSLGTIDPAQQMSIFSLNGMNLTHNNLVGYKAETAEIVPELAESWTISPDNKVITFKLRKGVKFHDGTPFNAQAVKFSWDRMLKANLSPAGKYKSYADENSVEVVDDYTLLFKPTKPNPSVMDWFAGGGKFYPVSPTYVKAHETEKDPLALEYMTSHECGTGPFVLNTWEPDAKYSFTKFDGYWGGTPDIKPAPKVNQITYKIIKDSSSMRMMLEKGDIDIADGLPADTIKKLKGTPGIKIKDAKLWKIAFIIMNCKHKPLDNPKVRQAMSYAIDYDQIIKYVEDGRAKRLIGTMTADFEGYSKGGFKYPYDVAKAKKLMAEAGYPNGFDITLNYSPDRYVGFELMSVLVQSYLKKIGINLKLQKTAWATQVDIMKKGNFDMALQTWTAYYPEAMEQNFFFFATETHGARWNWSFWTDPEIDKTIDQLKVEFDPEKRAEMVKKIQATGIEQAVYIYLYEMSTPIAYRDSVHDMWYHPGLAWVPSPVYKTN